VGLVLIELVVLVLLIDEQYGLLMILVVVLDGHGMVKSVGTPLIQVKVPL
jgi:hypothetical protein